MDKFDDKNINEQMDTLIARIYEKFAQYSIKEIKGVCTGCCVSKSSIEEIITVPLRELSWHAVYEYLDAAKYDVEFLIPEAKYLLPRIIELYISSEYVRQPPEFTFQTCHFDKAAYWCKEETDLIREFAELHFKKTIIEKDTYFQSNELIFMWYEAGLNIDFLFDIWIQAVAYPKALYDYAGMLQFSFKDLNYESDWTSYALDKQLTDWALSDEVFNIFSNKILLAIENIDSVDDHQLDAYEYVLQLI